MEYVSNLLFWISNGLLVPVVVGLLFFFVRSIFMLGGFYNRYMQRRKVHQSVASAINSLSASDLSTLRDTLAAQSDSAFIRTARALEGFTVFYNGPRCGASAPDHLHFQAGNRGFLPLEREVAVRPRRTIIPADTHGSTLYTLPGYLRPLLVLRSACEDWLDEHLQGIIARLPVLPGEAEPRFNLLGWHDAEGWTLCLFPRTEHRPRRFHAEGDDRLLLSPASVDLAGVFIAPREEDFLRITPQDLRDTLREVTPAPDEVERIIQ